MMAHARQFHALAHQRVEFHWQALPRTFLLRRRARFEHLFHRVQQAIGIEQHGVVKLPPLRLVKLERLQCLEIKPDGRDRRFQFMSDGVDEAVMLLVAPNLAYQKNRIEDKASDDGAKKNDAKKNLNSFAPVEDDPSAANRKRHRRQANAQREESVDRLLPADDAHREIVKGQVSGCECNGEATLEIHSFLATRASEAPYIIVSVLEATERI